MPNKEEVIAIKKALKELYHSLPESSKDYLSENFKEMSFQTFLAYMAGFLHGREQVLGIVNEHIRRVDKILYGWSVMPLE